MGWGSIITTAGSIIGQLLGGMESVSYSLPKSGAYLKGGPLGDDDVSEVEFIREYSEQAKQDRYLLYNRSKQTEDAVALCFPSRGTEMGPETMVVNGRETYDVTRAFSLYGANDNSQFELSPYNDDAEGGAAGDGGSAQVSSYGYNIPTDGKSKRQIGSRVAVTVDAGSGDTPATVKVDVDDAVLQAISSLSVTGVSDTAIKMLSLGGQSGASALITLPHTLQSSFVDVSVVVKIGGASSFADACRKDALARGELKQLGDDEYAALERRLGR